MNKLKRKVNRFLILVTKVKERLVGGGYDFSSPEAIQIETTINCNLKCSICNVEMKNRTIEKTINFEKFKKIFDQLGCVNDLNLTGYGEPLANPDIFEMIKYAKTKGAYVQFATNATMLNNEKAEVIISSGLDFIIFSVDSGDSNSYEKIRIGANFQRVKENIKNFMALKKERNSKIRVEIYSVIIFSNLGKLKGLIDLADELGISKIKIRGLVDHTGKGKEYDKEALYHPDNVEVSEKAIAEAKEYAVGKNIIISCPPLRPVEGYQCRMPSQKLFISVEGHVTPCCVQGMDPRNINFGNIYELDFKDIWNNKKIKIFRKALFTSKPPSICTACPRLKGLA